MSTEARFRIPAAWVAAGVLAAFAAGAATAYLAIGRHDTPSPEAAASTRAPAAPTPESPAPGAAGETVPPAAEIAVQLSDDAIARAGIVVEPVSTTAAGGTRRLPAVIAANAYKEVAVTPLVGGRVTRVLVELGDRVARGQPIAEVYSPELAEAWTRYASATAQQTAAALELERTRKLVDVGATSVQELERVQAAHASQSAAVDASRSRLELLGVPRASLAGEGEATAGSATIVVPAPIDGVVTARDVNLGLNVESTSRLFTVVDLSTVWVVFDLYEDDFAAVRVGHEAVVRTPAYPSLTLRGRIGYIDPQVDPMLRTAKGRVEVPNRSGDLRLGMYAEVVVTTPGRSAAMAVPRTALQQIGTRTVVFVADAERPGRFLERAVQVGPDRGELVEVLSGLRPGEAVVTTGSFFLRAERERLGIAEDAAQPGRRPDAPAGDAVEQARVVIDERGFQPARVVLHRAGPARVTFLRATDDTCATSVVFPSLSITRALPLNQAVTIELAMTAAAELTFVCGMNMLKGAVAVDARATSPARRTP